MVLPVQKSVWSIATIQLCLMVSMAQAQEYIPPPSGPWTLSPVIVQPESRSPEPSSAVPASDPWSVQQPAVTGEADTSTFQFPPSNYNLDKPLKPSPGTIAAGKKPEPPSQPKFPNAADLQITTPPDWVKNPWAPSVDITPAAKSTALPAAPVQEPNYDYQAVVPSQPWAPVSRPQQPYFPPQGYRNNVQNYSMPNPWNMMPMQPFFSFTP